MTNHNKYKEIYRVSASVYPTHRANAKHTQVSSGRVPLHYLSTTLKLINFSDLVLERAKEAEFSGADGFDRVEIINPRGLVKGMKYEDLGRKSSSRNNLLFGVMQRMKLVEKIGSGIKRMRELMQEYGLKAPFIETDEHWFTITFKRKEKKTTQKILELIKKNPHITRKELAGEINITEDGIKYHLEGLRKRGILRRIGPDKGGHWEVLEENGNRSEGEKDGK